MIYVNIAGTVSSQFLEYVVYDYAFLKSLVF